VRNCYLATDLETVSQSRGGGAPVWEGGRVWGLLTAWLNLTKINWVVATMPWVLPTAE
jgi:hypothetical protein